MRVKRHFTNEINKCRKQDSLGMHETEILKGLIRNKLKQFNFI